jgi:hypothetical protein
MLDITDYAYSGEQKPWKQIISDIKQTCELGQCFSQKYEEQGRLVESIHNTIKYSFNASLWIFMGIRLIHWFYQDGDTSSSIHIEREKLFHLADHEIAQLFASAFLQRDKWIDCNLEALEDNMPHVAGEAFCVNCSKRWDVIYSLLSPQREQQCSVCGNKESVLVSLQTDESNRHKKRPSTKR